MGETQTPLLGCAGGILEGPVESFLLPSPQDTLSWPCLSFGHLLAHVALRGEGGSWNWPGWVSLSSPWSAESTSQSFSPLPPPALAPLSPLAHPKVGIKGAISPSDQLPA